MTNRGDKCASVCALCIAILCCASVCPSVAGDGSAMVKLLDVPTGAGYKAADTEYDDGGMAPLYNFARSFINTSLPGGFPTEFINETITDFDSGKIDMMALAQKLLKTFMGYVVSIVVGFLFIIIMPLVGCCFCCCRLCGNCGGKNVQKPDDSLHCKRRVFACVLFVLVVFTFVGNICTYVSNDRMTKALDEISENADNNLDDITTFIDLLQTQVETIAINNSARTKDAIITKMDPDEMADAISIFVLDSLSAGAMNNMQTNIQKVVAAATQMNESLTALKAITMPSSLPNPAASITIPPSFSSSIANFTSNDPVAQVKSNLTANIKSKLGGSISTARSQIEKAFNAMDVKVQEVLTEIKDFKSQAKDGMNVESYKAKVKSYTDTAKDFDKYRHIGGVALGAIITLVVVLQLFGLVFGTLGQGMSTEPTERGCVSNAGGNMLIASVAFIFLFASLLMLLTTLCFTVGAILERFVCQPLSDPELKLIKVAEGQFKDLAGTLGAPISSVLVDCRNDKAAYEAFHLETRFNISDIDKILSDNKAIIDKQLNDSLGSLTNINGVADYSTQASASFSALESAFSQINLSKMKTDVSSVLNGPQAAFLPPVFKNRATDLIRSIDELILIETQIPVWKTDFVNGMATAQSKISTELPKQIDAFKDAFMSIADQFVQRTKNDIQFKVGKCSPVWNLYNSIVIVSLCKYTIDAFNGFWFSIGWCLFFFVPSLIFSVRLAKHYRTMVDNDGSQPFKGNQVGHGEVA